jgi:hypothetical protein
MGAFVLGMLVCVCTVWVSAQSSVREIDFKNFTYPLSGPLLGHSAMIGWVTLKTGTPSGIQSVW